MMSHTAKKDEVYFVKGTKLTGRWKKSTYTVVKHLGRGMIGSVYLCQTNNKLIALKISEQAMKIATEFHMLKELNEVQDSRLGPLLYEMDDWQSPKGKVYSFYTMEYIASTPIDSFVINKGAAWLCMLLVQFLDELEKIHKAGLVLGDLKKEHLLIEADPTRIRCIDVGGMTKQGRSIKEYSDFYDRAYWQLGTRKAEASYDLFALVMIVLAIYYPQPFKRQAESLQTLSAKINAVKEISFIRTILLSALEGKYQSAERMKEELIQVVVTPQLKRKDRKKKRSNYIKQSLIITCIASVFYGLSFIL